jgi:hypothetical protein
MINNKWLPWLNSALLSSIGIFILGTAFIALKNSDEIIYSDPEVKVSNLPKGAFALSKDSYIAIGEPVLSLQSEPPSIQVPDLRQQLIYYGKNGRPDAQANKEVLHFSFNGSKQIAAISPKEKLYLRYEKSQSPSKYIFSQDNAPTSLWLTADPYGQEATIDLVLQTEEGDIISEPSSLAHFKLSEKEFVRNSGVNWDVGGFNADGALLVRQKAKWVGPDYFLEHHGGDEYKRTQGKQKIEFGEGDQLYSVFVAEGDCMIWQNNRWKEVVAGTDSLGSPLLVVKKIDDRIMALELWDVAGKGKITLNLLKSVEPWMAQNGQIIHNTFKFVGARTRSKYIFEVNQDRILLSPQDWLIYLPADGGWKKLETAEAIDAYVDRKQTGALFVFEGVSREGGQQTVIGKLFSPGRSECKVIELPIQQSAGVSLSSKNGSLGDDDDDDSDDEVEIISKKGAPPKKIGIPAKK